MICAWRRNDEEANILKKILSVLLAVMLLCSMLPVGALAAYDATKPACQKPGHEKFDGTNHDRPQSCWVKGHFNCDGMNHDRAPCGVWGHFNCDGREHLPAACGAEGHYACKKSEVHTQAACGLEGHCVIDGKNHTQAACGIAGHLKCDGMVHQVLACGHYGCDGQDHSAAVCGAKGHYACDGIEHAIAECGKNGHCVNDGKVHVGSPCGYPGHVGCDGRNHELAACGVDGHYACAGGRHYDKVVSKYCNAVPQHKTCEGNPQHYCDPAYGGCGVSYLCNRSNAHTPCRMCGQLWCDRSLGGHETPCGKANHRPCVYAMNGKTYSKYAHDFCGYCGRPRCERDEHGNGKCVDSCPKCGGPEKMGKDHKLPCGRHYSCKTSGRIHEETCSVCGKYICDGKGEHSHPELRPQRPSNQLKPGK